MFTNVAGDHDIEARGLEARLKKQTPRLPWHVVRSGEIHNWHSHDWDILTVQMELTINGTLYGSNHRVARLMLHQAKSQVRITEDIAWNTVWNLTQALLEDGSD